MRVGSEFVAFERHSLKREILAQMWLEFWKSLIPAGSASFLLSVTGLESPFYDTVHSHCVTTVDVYVQLFCFHLLSSLQSAAYTNVFADMVI